MNSATGRLRTAWTLGLLGGSWGIAAGLVQALFGHEIPAWSGAKSNPVGLGLLTVLLSGGAVLAARGLRRTQPLSTERRALALVGLLVPAALCVSTVGRLWYVPGVLLVMAGALVMSAGSGRHLAVVIRNSWLSMLLGVLGGFELLLAVSAAPVALLAVGILGGLLLLAVPWAPAGPREQVALIMLATLPFAVLVWWSLAAPLIAILAIGLGLTRWRHGTPGQSAALHAVER